MAFSKLSLTPLFLATALGSTPAVGARVQIYDAGTLQKRTVYQDAELTVAHPWPIVIGASGRIPPIFVDGDPYRVRILGKGGGAPIEDIDGIPAQDAGSASDDGAGSSSDLITGDVVWSYRTSARTNFVRLNGRTIGSALSGASEFAGDAALPLYLHLWTVDTSLAVAGGRGTSAAADWAANKTIALPDARGRSLRGLDTMGSNPAGRLSGATFLAGDSATLGSACGTATETLNGAQVPAHSHVGSTSGVGGHSHSGTTSANGAHAHSASSGGAGGHGHSGSTSSAGAHAHSGATSQDGFHAHSGTTAGAGSHTHTVKYLYAQTYASNAVSGAVQLVGSEHSFNDAGTTDPAGSHTHPFVTDGAGSHGHSITTDTAGDHAHSFVTSSVGDHAHSVTVDAVGDHAHTFGTSTDGAHSHTIATDTFGGGGAHNNVSPSLLGTWFMRL